MNADKRDASGKGGKGGSAVQSAPDRASMIQTIKEWAASDPGAAAAAMEALKDIAKGAASAPSTVSSGTQRAICLGGGGPVLGLHIGVLERLKEGIPAIDENEIRFNVWALSCIGAWVGIVYNQAKEGREIQETLNFFRGVFRDDESFQSFPMNTIFAPDWAACANAICKYVLEPANYMNAFLPKQIMESYLFTLSRMRKRLKSGKFSEGDFNRWTFNHVLAVHPAVRFLTGLLYKAELDGRARLHYKDSKFLNDIKFDELDKPGKPYIFHNAFNFAKRDVDLFSNNARRGGRGNHKPITAESLCACSALPFIEQTVQVDGEPYCEGALIDTLNFYNLLLDCPYLNEIWISRIVDARQIRKPKNQHDALANLCQMFAGTVGADDVKLFKFHVRENFRKKKDPNWKGPKWEGIIVDIPVDDQVNFEWAQSNLEKGRSRGRIAADAACKLYAKYRDEEKYKDKQKQEGVLIIPDDLSESDIAKAGLTQEQVALVMASRPSP